MRKYTTSIANIFLALFLVQCVSYRPIESSFNNLSSNRKIIKKINDCDIYFLSKDSALFRMEKAVLKNDTLSGLLAPSYTFSNIELDSFSRKEEKKKKNTIVLSTNLNLNSLMLDDIEKFSTTRFQFHQLNTLKTNRFKVNAAETIVRSTLFVMLVTPIVIVGSVIIIYILLDSGSGSGGSNGSDGSDGGSGGGGGGGGSGS